MTAGRIVILSQRRCGAAAAYRLLAPWVAARGLGGQPFEWSRALGQVSQGFHEGGRERARALLDEHLAQGLFFHHRYDAEAWDFNAMLLAALERAQYRVLVVDRGIDADQLLSIAIAERLGCRARTDVEKLRDRLRGGAEVPEIDGDDISTLVQGQLASKRWLERTIGASGVESMTCRYEDLFLRGVKALEVADAMFVFCGIGPRAAVVDDASLLRFALTGQFYTSGLAAYSPSLRRAREAISAALSQVTTHHVSAQPHA